MGLLREVIDGIKPVDSKAKEITWKFLDSLSKPVRSLGHLEEIVVKFSGITGKTFNEVKKKNILIFCADNGVCDEGVSGCSQEVTTIVTNNLPNYTTGVGALAKFYKSHITVVDVGVKGIITNQKVINKRISNGTNNMAIGPAMTKDQAIRAIEIGVEIADETCKKGYDLLGTGEMGIGNTSTSAAVIAALLQIDVENIVGLGAGLSKDGFENKKKVLKKAIEVNKPNSYDVIDVLSKVGGYDIAAMCGAFLGAARNKTPIVIDGLISCAAALCAYKLNPHVVDYIFPSHKSSEKAVNEVFKTLNLKPMLDLNMRLGEGSGCPVAFSIIESALYIVKEMNTFSEAGIGIEEEIKYRENWNF